MSDLLVPAVGLPGAPAGLAGSAGTSVLRTVGGEPAAEVADVAPLIAQDALERLTPAPPTFAAHSDQTSETGGGPGGLAADDPGFAAVFADAGKLFESGEPDGLDAAEYVRITALTTGLPSTVIRAGLDHLGSGLAEAPRAARAQLPDRVAGPGRAVAWVRRGPRLAVVAPSNSPEPHLAWIRALALGYAVAVRPGGRDPFTPARLARALLAAGLPADRLAVLPGGQTTGAQLLKAAPLGLVYGGPDVARRWAGRPNVLVRGPGRSKAAIRGPWDERLLDHLVHSVAADGGTRCTNTSVILTDGDPLSLADALAERLATRPVLPVTDPAAVLPALDRDRAAGVRTTLASCAAAGFTDHSSHRYGGDPFAPLPDGSLCARPVVLSAPAGGHPLIGTELPMPFTIVASWNGEAAALRDSLVVNLLGERRPAPEAELLAEPSVRRVVAGAVEPWYTDPELPHDGSFAGFLMEPKTVLWERGLPS
jgi:hypothetical protein